MTKSEKTGLGKLAAQMESALAWLAVPVPLFASEILSRASGCVMELANFSQAEGTESRIRGILAASCLNSTGLRIGRGVTLYGRRNIRFGNGVSIGDGVFLSATGAMGRIDIGNNTHIDVCSVFYGQGGLTIGDDCAIASGVIIYTQTNQYDSQPLEKIIDQGTRYASVTLGSDVWIGAGARVLPGVTVEDHAVIGAGAVVTRNVEPWTVVAGVPARVIKERKGTSK